MPRPAHRCRLLLPRGAVELRADLGEFLKRRRQGKLDGEAFGTQEDVAARVGVTRQTLSDIERGHSWPGPETLDALLDVLDLGWEHVAHAVEVPKASRYVVNDMPGGGRLAPMSAASAPSRHRTFLEGDEGKQIIAFGERVRAARKQRGLTLAAAADAAGVSLALLSRIERAQFSRSHVFCFEPVPGAQDKTQLVILNSWLARLCDDSALGEDRDEWA